ncbi:Holliday junction resolvase RecU [Facklamia miroungae]|uniref:Holliday junction resolvase RecU n=1 Tax=Facklamia miroungae TaxID=120956 RepID=A0A1G7PMK8_9LACT|nr:Holliday junction resolvase RecU [Facklamia miroungae]NKZ28743.1 Holliday junction resolvase RecU [Facklamia miroungae]SDF86620.1 recombination protein U [Facklamia miroungae]
MIKYPAGQGPRLHLKTNPRSTKQATQYGSRGMTFEEMINQSNAYYLNRQLAVIHKKPTPIQIVKVDYPKRSAAKITEAYFRQASTTDYNGVYLGRYIDFETKETRNKTSFPLSNLHDHQIEHMKQCHQQGGLVFLLIYFKAHDTIYLIPYPLLEGFIQKNKKQSIPYAFIQKNAYACPQGQFPISVDYLSALDAYIEQADQNEV